MESNSFMDSIIRFFCKNKIVAGQRDAEDDRCDALEAVDPLLALGPGEGETLWLR